jgi:hypothetical protein
MDTFLVPLEGLTLPGVWDLGAVRLHTEESAKRFLDECSNSNTQHSPDQEQLTDFRNALDSAAAQVHADTIDEAVDLTTTAVDILRVFQQANTHNATTMFGLPGQIQSAVVRYAQIHGRVGIGWKRTGGHLGWTFGEAEDAEFQSSTGFRFAADALGAPHRTEAQRRAILGIQLASQSILDHRPAMKVLSALMAAEAMLLERSTTPQAFRLARRVAFFTCGTPEGEHCGRGRPTCPVVGTSPDHKAVARLKELRTRGNADFRWRCSEWHRALDWYDLRSEIVHGGNVEVSDKDANEVVFWLLHDLVPPTLEWLASHASHPLDELDSALDALPAQPDWNGLIKGAPQ